MRVGVFALCFEVHVLFSAGTNVYPIACPDGICPGLGNAFYLPKANAVADGGVAFAKNTKLGTCATWKEAESTTRSVKNIDSMKKLVQDTNTEWSLSGSITTAALTAKGSVEVSTDESSERTSSFHSGYLDITYITKQITLERSEDCSNDEPDFDSEWINSFKSLPDIDPLKVHESTEWIPYVNFLETKGSHVMVEQSIGSRFQHWESSTSSSSDVSKSLEIKACAQVEGVGGVPGWSVKSCAAYTDSEKKEALQTESYTHNVILGGSESTRIAIAARMANDTLTAFIDAAPNGTQAVSYGFHPVWELLINLYTKKCKVNFATTDDCQHLQHAYNLHAAYEGWVAFKCPRKETSNGVVYQSMAISDPSATFATYQCNAAKTGCYSNDDCHIGGAGSVCYCYGSSCIDSGDVVADTTLRRDKVQGAKSGHWNSGVNNACYYKVGVYCDCHFDWAGGLGERQLWVQGASLVGASASLVGPSSFLAV